jgi:hydrogenase expression/formation protein HypE
LKVGKLDNETLLQLVLANLPVPGASVSAGPAIGLDCAAIKFGDGQVIVTADPITGAKEHIGRLAIHISCNDVACCGIRPSAVLLVIIAPPEASSEDLEEVVKQAAATASQMSVSIVGGHTEVSSAVRQFIIITTALGFTYGRQLVLASGGRAGDTLIMTKTAGLEGTAILASDHADRLAGLLTSEEISQAASLVDFISVVEEGTCGGSLNVHAMHDATEGGILGACWELAEASGLGCIIEPDQIPVHPLTARMCNVLNLDPLRLIASGSMLMATSDPENLVSELNAKNIKASIIGKLTENPERLLKSNEKLSILLPPGSDELYKIT